MIANTMPLLWEELVLQLFFSRWLVVVVIGTPVCVRSNAKVVFCWEYGFSPDHQRIRKSLNLDEDATLQHGWLLSMRFCIKDTIGGIMFKFGGAA